MALSENFISLAKFLIVSPLIPEAVNIFPAASITTGLSVSVKEGNGKFGNWSELKPVSIVVNLDTKKNRIVIYSEVIQLFEINYCAFAAERYRLARQYSNNIHPLLIKFSFRLQSLL